MGAILATLSNDSRHPDRLPLEDVPESELSRIGIVLEPSQADRMPISRDTGETLAHEIACCGDIQQTVLVRLRRPAAAQVFIAWAVNFDTATGFDTVPYGGLWKIDVLKGEDFLVLFLDARTGKFLCSLGPGTECIWPQSASSLEGIQPDDLSEIGLRLDVPTDEDYPKFVPDWTELAATAPFQAPIREVILVRALEGGVTPSILVWAVSYGTIGPPISYSLLDYLFLYHADAGGLLHQLEIPVEE